MERGGISSELILEKKILKLNFIIIMKNYKNFRFLSGGRNGLPVKIRCSVLVSVCVWYTYLFESGTVMA